MIQLLRWVGRRFRCFVQGHRMTSGRIFYPPAKSVIPGYRCERCDKTQSLLLRWQEVRD